MVAENGALLLNPATRKESTLAPEPPKQFIEALRAKKVQPLSVGRSIVATWEPNETAVLQAIRELGVELQITFNKGAVMAKVLERPDDSVVVNMLAVSVGDRPAVFARFLSAIVELRARAGRPHWILVDEAHHVLPAERDPSVTALDAANDRLRDRRSRSDGARRPRAGRGRIAVGTRPVETIAAFCRAIVTETPPLPAQAPERGQAHYWGKGPAERPEVVTLHPPAEKSERHRRKYADGELGEDRSFDFRGPKNALNLRAQNLMIFLQIADGVDDETWLHHLKPHDVSRWIRDTIKDEELADEVRKIEEGRDPSESRRRMRETIERRYTAATGSDAR